MGLPARVTGIERLAPRAVRLRFGLPDDRIPPYRPGQDLRARILADGFPSSPLRMPVSSCRYEKGSVEAILWGDDDSSLRSVDAFLARPGGIEPEADISFARGCSGRKRLRDGEPLALLADPGGVASCLSLLGHLSWTDSRRPVTLLWAADTRDDLAGYDEVLAWEKTLGRLRVVPVLAHDPLWTGERGGFDRATLERALSAEIARAGTRYVVSARGRYRGACIKALGSAGVAAARISSRMPGI